MKTVAAEAGVSTMTVSRTLANPAAVSPEMRARIQAVIDRLGYVPNKVAGSLSSNRTTHVALVLPTLRTSIFAEMIQGISDTLRAAGYQLMISDSGNSEATEEEQIRAYVAQRVCGLILHNTSHSPAALRVLANAGIPCVETGDLVESPVDSVVSYSNRAAGAAMAAHLLASGYKQFAFVSLAAATRERIRLLRDGFTTALKRAGHPIPPALRIEVEGGLENGALALSRVLQAAPRTEAIFFAGDVLAAGALFECQRRGIAVPKKLAIANSDDTELIRNTVPSITSVHYPRYEIGRHAAQAILARARGESSEPVHHDVGFCIVQRQST